MLGLLKTDWLHSVLVTAVVMEPYAERRPSAIMPVVPFRAKAVNCIWSLDGLEVPLLSS